jgi:hypothetical protein
MTLFYGDITDERIFAKATKSENDYNSSAAENLDPEHEYLVTFVEVGGFHTDIYLNGRDETFNSVCFTFYKDNKEIDIIEYLRPRFTM